MKRFLLICLGLLCFTIHPFKVYGMSEQEIIERLDALTRTVEKQQEEIRYLRQQLDKQSAVMKETKTVVGSKTDNVVVKEPEKKKSPEWIERVKIGGDLRLRYEGIYNREQRQADGSTVDLPTRDRYRIRARLFVDGTISDEVSAHFMICTNQDSNKEATTTNQSFANDFNDKDIYLI